ncbi:hypothetical protein BDV98DRAFT_561017 [Pterulicium gracile]|uniref:MARVEL domain-containing protein n=1 Tax=Pterulicium gracile TaxID=1884261 RepID=A0A5C3QYV5_9AGAR|nr:hypothetical protein BDV98DRAFT_561017 [Pterula gracilis]
MTVRFTNHRLGLYVFLFALSGTVLGISAFFANQFLPKIRPDFTIFSIVVSALTILVFLLMLQFAQPWTEAIAYFILGILWLTMAAWSTDIVGNVQCDALGGQRIPIKNGGDMSAQSWCYQMKVTQAFSWTAFILLFLALFLLMHLCGQAQRFGRPNIWKEPIQELGWFGEWPGYYNTHSPGAPGMPGSQQYFPGQQYPQSGYPGQQYPQGYPQSGYPQGSYSNMQHSHSGGRAITIQHQPNGGAPVVTTTPI